MVLKFLIKKIVEQPIIRTVLIVLSVFYIFKQKFLHDEASKDMVKPIITEQETPEQREYKESQSRKGIWLTIILFAIFAVLKYSNVQAEKKEILARQAAKESAKQERLEELEKKKEAGEIEENDEIEGIREWNSDDEEYDNKLRN